MGQVMLPGMENTLPLFSGTAPRAKHKPLKHAEDVSRDQASYAECKLCKDTGRLKNADRLFYCWCEAGIAARASDREAGRSIREVTTQTVLEVTLALAVVWTALIWTKVTHLSKLGHRPLLVCRMQVTGSYTILHQHSRGGLSKKNTQEKGGEAMYFGDNESRPDLGFSFDSLPALC